MKISVSAEPLTQARADLLAVGVGSDKPERAAAVVELDGALGGALRRLMKEESFSGQPGETLKLLGGQAGGLQAARLLLVGIGQEPAADKRVRLVAIEAARAARDLGSVAVACPDVDDATLAAAAEGLTTGAYRYTTYLTGDRRPKGELKRAALLVSKPVKGTQRAVQRGTALGEAINLTRDLVNAPPNDLYPETLAEQARQACDAAGIKCKVYNERQLDKLGMQLFLAVGRGSARPPRLVHMTYTPRSAGKKTKKVVLVGKGVTFDSGGLCLKPPASMADMKCDMAGAAATVGVLMAAAKLGLPVEVHGLIGAVENMNGSHAYRPGDVFTSRDGKTVEIINTDAEGRLVLADVLSYAKELEPDYLIDHATLTGACVIALGNHTAGLFSNDDGLAERYLQAAADSGESYWRMPLTGDLKESLKSGVADLKHTGTRYGGAITAALFLQEFVGESRWAHVDIAGPAYLDRQHGPHPKGGTGFGVLTAIKLLESL